MNTRRDLLVSIAATTTLAAADKPAVHVHAHEEAQASPAAMGPYVPKFFSAAELSTVGSLCEVIIPKTSTPGALDAKVHELIDEMLTYRKPDQAVWKKGLAEVDALSQKLYKKAYSALNDEQQVAVMVDLSNTSKFFGVLKGATVDMYYSTKEGLMSELGWNANVPLPEFKGCTHPEHQS